MILFILKPVLLVLGMFSCIQLINTEMNLNIKIVNIFSSYMGIEKFAEKKWTDKKKSATKFCEFFGENSET